MFIDPETCTRVCYQIFCGTYPNRTYRSDYPTCFCKVVVRVLVGFSDLFTSIYCFDLSKISFKLFVQVLFYSLLTYLYHIHCISTHWSWNLSSVVLENWQWVVSKPDIRNFFPCRFVECRGKGSGFFWFHLPSSIYNWFQGISSSSLLLVFALSEEGIGVNEEISTIIHV